MKINQGDGTCPKAEKKDGINHHSAIRPPWPFRFALSTHTFSNPSTKSQADKIGNPSPSHFAGRNSTQQSCDPRFFPPLFFSVLVVSSDVQQACKQNTSDAAFQSLPVVLPLPKLLLMIIAAHAAPTIQRMRRASTTGASESRRKKHAR